MIQLQIHDDNLIFLKDLSEILYGSWSGTMHEYTEHGG